MPFQLADHALLFHNYWKDCPGVIVSDENGALICAECKRRVGNVDIALLRQLVELIPEGNAATPNPLTGQPHSNI